MMEMASAPPFGLRVRTKCQPPANSAPGVGSALPALPLSGMIPSTAEAGTVAKIKIATMREESRRDVAI
jgi:hypothetical protein